MFQHTYVRAIKKIIHRKHISWNTTAEVYIFITLFSGWFTRNLFPEFTRLFAKTEANERI